MKRLEFLHLDSCQELLFQVMCLFLIFTTHPVVLILIFRLGGIIYFTQTELIYIQHTLHQLIFTIFLTLYCSAMLILFTLFILLKIFIQCILSFL